MTNIDRTTILSLVLTPAFEAIGQIEALGIVGEAARVVDRAQGGPAQRHAARTSLALVAALTAQGEKTPAEGWTLAAASDLALASAWWRLTLDIGGVGGSGDCEGLATARLPPFAGLGKGRRQASDGAAWGSAIRDAAALAGEELAARGKAVLPRTLEVVPVDDGAVVVRIGGSLVHGIEVLPCLREIRWWVAEARRRLVAAAREGRDDAPGWGRLYNHLHAVAERWRALPAWVQDAYALRGEGAIDEAETAAALGDDLVPNWIKELARRCACPESLVWLREHRDLWCEPEKLLWRLPSADARTWGKWLAEEYNDGWAPPTEAPPFSKWAQIAQDRADGKEPPWAQAVEETAV